MASTLLPDLCQTVYVQLLLIIVLRNVVKTDASYQLKFLETNKMHIVWSPVQLIIISDYASQYNTMLMCIQFT